MKKSIDGKIALYVGMNFEVNDPQNIELPTQPAPLFSDVPEGYWAKQEIEDLFTKGIMNSCQASPAKFCPDSTITRIEFIRDMLRAKYGGTYSPPAASHYFADMAGNPLEAWADQAYRDGITSGCSSSPRNFCPTTVMTRSVSMVFLLRTKHGGTYTPPAALHYFPDSSGNSFEAWIDQGYREGLTTGCGGGNFCPNTSITRAASAIFTENAFNYISHSANTQNLIAWWSMDESDGVRHDSFRNNHLSSNNQVGTGTGHVGGAASFSPTGQQYLSIADNSDLSTGDVDFTIIANVFLNSTSANMVIASKGDPANVNNRDFTLSYESGVSSFAFRAGNGTTSGVVYGDPVTSGQWYTIVAWHDSVNNKLNIQVNNGLINAAIYSSGAKDTTFSTTIGGFAYGTTLDGKVDEVVFYKRLLTSDERSWYHNNAAGRAYKDIAFANTGNWRKYYFAGTQRVAMRECTGSSCSTPVYFVNDHLGSTSLVTDASGAKVSEMHYSAWGEVLPNTIGTKPDYTYTGQRSEMDSVGLMFYNARWLDPYLKHFVSPDSLIPDPYNSLDYNRYAYVRYNPLVYSDPSGHNPACGPDGVWCSNNFEEAYGVVFEGSWTDRDMRAVRTAVKSVALKFAITLGWNNSAKAFSMVYHAGITFAKVDSYTYDGVTYYSGAVTKSDNRIEVASLSQPRANRTSEMAFTSARNNIVHELGHAFAKSWQINQSTYDQSGPYGNQKPIPANYLNNEGFYPNPVSANQTWRQHPCSAGESICRNETFADMFLGWTYGKWADNIAGYWRNNYMNTNMAEWVSSAIRR